VEFHRSAFKHGFDESAILHAIDHAFIVIDLDPDSDPPKVLAIGIDNSGNFIEVIWLELDDTRELVIHAMALRSLYYNLLPPREDKQL
jgi:hypothetical protein